MKRAGRLEQAIKKTGASSGGSCFCAAIVIRFYFFSDLFFISLIFLIFLRFSSRITYQIPIANPNIKPDDTEEVPSSDIFIRAQTHTIMAIPENSTINNGRQIVAFCFIIDSF